MARDPIIPPEGLRQSQIPAGGVRPIIGGQVSMYGRTPASPPIRYGALRSDNGVYAGRVPFQPVNDSASPVIGAYSPYPTMLFAPRRPDSFVMMMDMMHRMMPNIDYTKLIQDLAQRAAKMPIRRGGGGAGRPSAPPATVKPPRGDAVLGRWSTADDYGMNDGVTGLGEYGGYEEPNLPIMPVPEGRSGRSVRQDSMEAKGQADAAQGQPAGRSDYDWAGQREPFYTPPRMVLPGTPPVTLSVPDHRTPDRRLRLPDVR